MIVKGVVVRVPPCVNVKERGLGWWRQLWLDDVLKGGGTECIVGSGLPSVSDLSGKSNNKTNLYLSHLF